MNYYTQLASFLASYRLKSTSAAAKVLSSNQSSVSRHIQELESSIKKTLFERTSKGLIPTRAADDLAHTIGPALDQIDNSLLALKGAYGKKEYHEIIYIGGCSDILHSYVVPVLSYLCLDGFSFDFHIIDRPSYIEKELNSMSIDFAVYMINVNYSTAESQSIHEVEYKMVGHQKYKDQLDYCALEQQDLQSLEKLPWVSYFKDFSIVNGFIEELFGKVIVPRFNMVINNELTILNILLKGHGIGILPKSACQPYLDSGKLVDLYPTKKPILRDLKLSWLPENITTPTKILVKDILLNSTYRYEMTFPY